jgi:hypothetical protein
MIEAKMKTRRKKERKTKSQREARQIVLPLTKKTWRMLASLAMAVS